MSIHAYILAGGKSSRMGTDKASMIFKGKPLIAHTIDLLKSVGVKYTIVSSNSIHDEFGERIDDLVNDKGPLSGIVSALTHSVSERNLILTCDTPFIRKESITAMLETDAEVVYVEDESGQIYPLTAVYSKDCLEFLASRLNENELSVRKAIAGLPSSRLMISSSELKNLNFPSDLV